MRVVRDLRGPLSFEPGLLRDEGRVNENFSLIVMCLFLLASLAFLAEQLTSYH
jgi:hypothetical protein